MKDKRFPEQTNMLIVAGFHICGDYFLLFRVFVPSIKIIV